MVIACDFDGCITESNDFPYINNLKEHSLEAIKNFQAHGHKVILWTCREGKYLDAAREVLKAYGVELDGYNYSPYQLQSRKIVADVYIDDKNVFMVDDVDWYKIEEYILSLGNKETKIVKDGYNG
jgi:hydroxymethylpyrimidine pyrophosphatase-like HAD family hydrolase